MALAEKASVGTPTALYVETGQQIPSVGTVARLAAALSVSAGWLAYGIGEQSHAGHPATCDDMGERLQAVRLESGHTRTELARLAELTPGSIAKIEGGGQAGVQTIERLAKALRVSPAWLAYGLAPRELPKRRAAWSGRSASPLPGLAGPL